MAAALLRGGGRGLCVNCIRRELCRLSWRPQVALLSSKTSDPRKQPPRKTHIKKAKPQPAVDVAKLLEQLFSQRRPDTSPTARGPAASRRPSPERRVFTKPADTSTSVSSSSQNVQTSSTSSHAAAPPAIPTAAAHIAMTAPPESLTSSPVLESPVPASETKLETPSPVVAAASPPGDVSYTAAHAPATSVTPPVVGTPVASSVVSGELPLAVPMTEPTVETLSAAPVQVHIAESEVDTLEFTPATVDITIVETPPVLTSTSASSAASVEAATASPVGTVESAAVFVEYAIDPTLGTAAESVETSLEDNANASLPADASYAATLASLVTSVTDPVVATTPVISMELPLAETTVVPSAEPVESFSAVPVQAASAHLSESETLESTPATLETVAETPAALASAASSSASVEHIDEPIVDPATASPVCAESAVESTVDTTLSIAESIKTSPEDNATDSPSGVASYTSTPASELSSAVPIQAASAHIAESGLERLSHSHDAVTETPAALTSTPASSPPPSVEHIDEAIVDAATASPVGTVESAAVLVESTVESTVNPALGTEVVPVETSPEDKASDDHTLNALTNNTIPVEPSAMPEAMTLESVTLAEITALVESLQTDVLFQTTSALDNKADTLTQDMQAQNVNGTEEYSKAAAETAENLTEALSENDSLLEDVAALEAETEHLMEELLFSIPASDYRNDVKPSSVQPSESSGNEGVTIAEAMTLESVTLAEVEADVGSLEADALKETKTALEKEAEILSKEEHTGEYTALEDGTTMVKEKAEPDILTLDSLKETAEALEAETDLVLGALFYSGSGPVHSTKSTVTKPESQSTSSDNEVLVTEQPINQEIVSKSVIDGEEEGHVLEAMTVESVTLAEVEAVLGTLENVTLTETMAQLEKEAEVHAKAERMGEESKVVDVAVFENTAEAADLTVDSLSEATEALEVETDVIMQAMFCVAGPVLETTPEPTLAPPESQNTAKEADHRAVVVENLISEEALSESVVGGETEENVSHSMTQESVTLPEVDARVEIVENAGLTQTATSQLEKEAEIFSKEESVGEKTVDSDFSVSEEKTEDEVLAGETLSEASGLPGAQQAETDMLVEELHLSAPGQESLGGEQTVVDEALTIETLTMSAVETLAEALEKDVLTDVVVESEMSEMLAKEQMSPEAVEEEDIPSESEILNNAEVLAEAAEALEHASAIILQDLLCPVSVPTSEMTSIQTEEQPDSPPPLTAPLPTPQSEVSPTLKEETVVTEEEIEESTQTEALAIDEGLDPVQKLFLEKIREYNTRSRMSGGPVDAGLDYEKHLSEEKAKLHKLYGGGDLESFPQFTFMEPLLGEDSSK